MRLARHPGVKQYLYAPYTRGRDIGDLWNHSDLQMAIRLMMTSEPRAPVTDHRLE